MRRIEELARLSTDQFAAVTAAKGRLIDTCMQTAGFPYQSPPTAEPPVLTAEWYPSESVIAAKGYTWRARSFAGSAPSVSPEQDAALSTCDQQSTTALVLAPLQAAQQQLNRAAAGIEATVAASDAARAAAAAWAACMASSGDTFANPDAAVAAADSMAGGLAGHDALLLAVRDYTCQRSTHYAESLQAARDEANTAWMAANSDLVAQARTAIASVVAAAG